MHGDYQFANVMFENGAPARLAAIVDWEMGTVGDPKLDLGWVVQSWPDDTTADEDRAGGYVDMTGMPSADEVLAHYAKTSGRQVDDIDYYCVLAKWKLAVVLEQGFQRAGGDEKLQAFGRSCSTSCSRRPTWPSRPTTTSAWRKGSLAMRCWRCAPATAGPRSSRSPTSPRRRSAPGRSGSGFTSERSTSPTCW